MFVILIVVVKVLCLYINILDMFVILLMVEKFLFYFIKFSIFVEIYYCFIFEYFLC